MTTPNSVNPDQTNASWAWDQLSECVDALIAAWQQGEPPRLGDYVTDKPPSLRRMILVELIKVDLEHRWENRRSPKQLEQYLAEFPELTAHGVPCDLIYEEFHIRRQLGDTVDPQHYFERFPKQAGELGRLLGLEAPHLSTTLVHSERAQQKISVGDEIDDFALLTELGKGAFASVFLARQKSMQRLVALKISADKGNEPATLAQFDHPHIVRVYDQRRLPERRLLLMYMQHIPGGTLESVRNYAARFPAGALSGKIYLAAIDEILERRGESVTAGAGIRHKLQHATWPQVICWLGARLASALAYAHGIGALHRDIKPANVLVAADGSPKLADFNISFSSKLEGATPAAYFGGSAAYMSPEQLEACDPAHSRQADELDGRSDIYSLAIMLWELLTGSRPFLDQIQPGEWSQQLAGMTARRRAGVSAETRTKLPPNCPVGLEQVLLRCLAPEPGDRFASASELGRQLDLCLQPRAQRLLQAPKNRVRQLMQRWPIMTLVIFGLMPNLVMSGLNIAYNKHDIVDPLAATDPDIRTRFNAAMAVVNSVAFPLGVVWVLGVFAPVVRAVRRLARRQPVELTSLARLRERCLKLGDYAALVSTCEWAATGFVFSMWLQLPAQYFLHFLTSQVLCGLISATLTFFCVTYVAVRMFYPALVQCRLPEAAEAGQLTRLGRRIWIYFGGAVAVPFLTIFPLVVLDTGRLAIAVLAAVGLAAFALAFWLDREIRTDLAALGVIVNPAGDSLASGDSESFWAAG